MAREIFMYLCPEQSGVVFVKSLDFFVSQKGLEENWGIKWKPIVAESVEDAREKACSIEPSARPYDRQAK